MEVVIMGRERRKWVTKSAWLLHGEDNGFDIRTRTSLKKSNDKEERSWYNIGRTRKWLDAFSFLVGNRDPSMWRTKEKWVNYGNENNYNEKSPYELEKSKNPIECKWYQRGHKMGWIQDFGLARKLRECQWKTKEEWIEYGKENEYEAQGPGQVGKSEDPDARAWYKRGHYKGWNNDFPFNSENNNSDQLEQLLDDYISDGGNENE
jgi:hypothetical protein